jgi:hypothetical protein
MKKTALIFSLCCTLVAQPNFTPVTDPMPILDQYCTMPLNQVKEHFDNLLVEHTRAGHSTLALLQAFRGALNKKITLFQIEVFQAAVTQNFEHVQDGDNLQDVYFKSDQSRYTQILDAGILALVCGAAAIGYLVADHFCGVLQRPKRDAFKNFKTEMSNAGLTLRGKLVTDCHLDMVGDPDNVGQQHIKKENMDRYYDVLRQADQESTRLIHRNDLRVEWSAGIFNKKFAIGASLAGCVLGVYCLYQVLAFQKEHKARYKNYQQFKMYQALLEYVVELEKLS